MPKWRFSLMTHGLRVVLCVGLMLFGASTVSFAQPPIRKTILFLSFYQSDLPVNTLAVQTIQNELRQAADLSVNIYYEYLDFNRFPDAAYQQAVLDLLTLKYRDKPVDLVMLGSPNMLELWLSKRAAILPNAPVLFYDMNTASAATLSLPPGVSGVTADVDFTKTIRWYRQARPNVSELILVHGVELADQTFLPYINAIQTEFCGTMQCTDWSSLPVSEMIRRAATLPDTAVIVYVLLFEDAAGVKFKPIDVIRQLAAVSFVPVLSGYDQFIGTGTIGGYLYSIEEQARAVTQMGLRILRGEPISAMPVQVNQGTRFIFDHEVLRRWNIPLSVLPEGSMLKHGHHSLWEEYHFQLIIAGVGTAGLIVLTIFLSILTRRLHAAREALRQTNATLEIQVRERTAALYETNQSLGEENLERQRIEEKLRKSEEQYHSFITQSFEGIYRTEFDRPVDVSLPVEAQIDAIYEYAYMAECNSALAQMYGLSSAEAMIGVRLIDAHGGKDNPVNRAAFRKFIEHGYKSINDETFEYDANGQPIWFLSNTIGTIENGYLVRLWGTAINITERKLAEQALRESEEKFSKAFHSSQVAMSLSTLADGRYLDVNAEFLRLAGRPYEEIVGHTSLELNVWAYPEQREKILKTIRDEGAVHNAEIEIRTKSGTILTFLMSAEQVVIRNAPCLLVSAFDISERKQTEKALQESEERYRRVSSVISDIAYSCIQNEEGMYVIDWMTGATERILGYTVDEILARRCWGALVLEEDFALFDQQIIRLAPGSRSACEMRLRHKNGSIRWLSSFAECAVSNNQYQLYGGLVDITERKQAEDARQRSEAFLDSIIEHSPNSLWIADEHGTLLRMNQACRDMFHVGDEDVIGKYNILRDNVVAEQGFLPVVRDVFDKGVPARFTIMYDTSGIKGLELRQTVSAVLDVHISPILDAQGHVANAVIQHVDITERRRTEEALRESEARWQFALEGAGDGVWDWDAQSNTVFFSNQWKAMLGFEPQEIGNSLSEWETRIHPDDRDEVYVAIQKHFDGQMPIYTSEHRVRCKDGAYKWILDRGKVISRTPDGKPLRVIGTHSDISTRKQAEQILQESEAKYRRLVENMPDILYVFSSARGGVYYSTHVETILGYAPDDLYQHPQLWGQSIHPDDRPKVVAAVAQFQQGEHFKIEYRIKHADGEWRWLYDRSIGRQDLPSETLIEGLALDITERKRAEDELRLFKSIVESSEEAIAVSDTEGRLVYINPAHVKLFGRTLEQARQANYREYYPPESVEVLNRDVAPALANGQSWQGVLDAFDASGRRFPLWEHADSIRDGEEKMLYGFGFMHDDTLRKNVEDTLKQAKADAEAANRMKSAFLANMSHELRTPLNAILGYAQILNRDQTFSEAHRKGLRVIEDSGNYLLELINDILDLAKIEAGRLEMHPVPMHLSTLLDDVWTMMAIKAEHKGLRFDVIREPDLPDYVEGDPRRLRQILLNLLGNAIKFTDCGSVTLRVGATPCGRPTRCYSPVRPEDGQSRGTAPTSAIYFEISDTGVGIAPEDMAKLFTPFQQVGDNARQAQGTGLGLAISRHLAELMGGTLTVTSEAGVGSAFRVGLSLPVLSPANAPLSARRVIVGVNGAAPTILVVDDVAENRQVLDELLTLCGCCVLQAVNGADALRQALASPPSAIITDLKMPDMDGLELIRRLRETPELEQTIIIISSASVYVDDREQSLSAGGEAFLPKPVQADILYEQLQTLGVADWRYLDDTPPAEVGGREKLPSFSTLKTLFELADIGDILGLREQLDCLAQSEDGRTIFVAQLQEFARHFQLDLIRNALTQQMEKIKQRETGESVNIEQVAIPKELFNRLQAAIMTTDIKEIELVIDDLREIAPILADKLAKLAYNFEYDQLSHLLQSKQP